MSEFIDKRGRPTVVSSEAFKDQRRRLDGKVLGKVTADHHNASANLIEYESGAVDPGEDDGAIVWIVNVPLSPDQARQYAELVTAAAGAAEVGPRRFEPGDAVTYPDLPRHWCAVVSTYTELGFGILNVHEYRPGDKDSGRNRAFIHRKIDQVERVDDEEPEDAAA